MRGYGHNPYVVSGGFDGEDPAAVHQRMAATMDAALDEIATIRRQAADGTLNGVPRWPMIVLRTPKG
jgi:xylulose-5-phosphate/fructose-6-phosphate phosphoketolase